jgi:hypothetical protein
MDGYADSVSSSPRSVGTGRGTDPELQRWEDGSSNKVRFMYSYGGKILLRPHDNQLCYLGGETRMVAVSRNITYADLIAKFSKMCGSSVTIKYQLPNEDLDALISVTTDEDLENMMEEYDRFQQTSMKSSRLRIFLFPEKLETVSSLGSLLDNSKREHWFVDALNGTPILSRGVSEGSSVSEMPDYLFGLDNPEYWDKGDDRNPNSRPINPGVQQGAQIGKTRMFNTPQPEGIVGHPPPDVHSAPDSPMLETSSYGSASSAPLGANLPPLKVKPVQEEPSDGQVQRGNMDNPFRRLDPNSHNLSMEGAEPRYVCEDMGRTMGYRVNNPVIVNIPDGHGSDVHNGGDSFFHTPQDSGLRTQDPRLNFDDHIAKLKNYHKQEQYLEPIPSKDGKLPASSPSETAINKPRPTMPENTERQIPIQHEFEQLHILNKQQQQQQQEMQIRPEYSLQEETLEGRHDWNGKPVNNKSPETSLEGGINQPAMKKETSNSSLSAMSGVKREGSQSSLEGDQRIVNRQVQDETNLGNIATGQMKQPDRPKYQDTGMLNSANPAPRDRPNPNLDRRTEDIESGSDVNYLQKDQNIMMQQTPQDRSYMPVQYEQQYVSSHYAHQGQPMSYYQVHHDPQQGDQPYPIYFVSAHHASPMLQTMNTVVHPGSGQPGYNMPLQRNMSIAPANAPAVYSTDVLSSKPVTTTMQPPTAPPIQKQPGYDSVSKVVNMAATPFRDQQIPIQPNIGPTLPRYRAPRPGQGDVRMIYRPPQQVNPSLPMYADQQYGYQHMQVPHNMGYEASRPQIYYTQNASIVNPPYQGSVPVNPDLQSSQEMLPEVKGIRVSQGF